MRDAIRWFKCKLKPPKNTDNCDKTEILYYKNFDLGTVVMPIDAEKFNQLLIDSNYDAAKRTKLITGYRQGFDIGYHGSQNVQITSKNLVLRVGSEIELWNKVMKEVKLKRYAGPFKVIPYNNYIQSPIGLVPKDGGRDTRLIFHLSYPRNGN